MRQNGCVASRLTNVHLVRSNECSYIHNANNIQHTHTCHSWQKGKPLEHRLQLVWRSTSNKCSSTGASIQLLLPVWTRVVPRQGDSTRYHYLHPPRTSNIKFTKHVAWDGLNTRCRTWNFDLPGEAKANNWWQSLHVDAGGNRPAVSNLLVHRSSQREMLGIFWEGTLDNNHYIIQKKLHIYSVVNVGKNISGTLPTGTQLFPWKSSASHVFWYCAWTTYARLSLQGSPWSSSAEPMPGNVMFFFEKKHMKKWGVLCKNLANQPGSGFIHMFIIYKLHKTRVQPTLNLEAQITYCNTVPLPAPTSALFCQDSVLGSHSVEPRIREIGWRGCLWGMLIVSTVHIVSYHFATDCLLMSTVYMILPLSSSLLLTRFSKKGIAQEKYGDLKVST